MNRVYAINGTFMASHWQVGIEESSHFVDKLLIKLRSEQVLERFMIQGIRNVRKSVISHKFRGLGE